ncbi:hypothetical protein EH220_06775 [bacterium]|nr:MAG: hypothetical protein EH220_06775 [bacterium]
MKSVIMFIIAVSVFSRACESLKDQPPKPVEGFGQFAASDLIIEPAQDEIKVEWGEPVEVPLQVSWAKGQKYAVQVEAAPTTPSWLQVETRPVILDPPGQMMLILNVDAGSAKLGKRTLELEASAYSLKEPLTFKLDIEIVRQSGDFEPVYAAPVTVECRNVCGKYVGGRVAFYDVLKEKGQSCADPSSIPESQKIGGREFALSNKGFGYGRTCKIACCYETGGSLAIVNLGYYNHSIPRGEALVRLRNINDCWLSPDNTILLAVNGSALTPYDALTGNQLGETCRIVGEFQGAALDGDMLTAFSSRDCKWQIK